MFLGPRVLREVIENAELYPIRGLFNFKDYFADIDAYYYQTIGYEVGVSTGWRALNQLYNVSTNWSFLIACHCIILPDDELTFLGINCFAQFILEVVKREG